MAVKSKKSISDDSILYIQDADAKALGIIEGTTQKVYINGKEVDVVFVDEHEVVPATAEEKKLYQDASKIAAKYNSIYGNEGKAMSRVMANSEIPEAKEPKVGFLKKLFLTSPKSREDLYEGSEKQELINAKKNPHFSEKKPTDDSFHLRNESFTVDELDIIKDIISTSNSTSTKSNSKALVPSKDGAKSASAKTASKKKPSKK
ncbi:MAG: hypothetical protein ACRC4M_03670 [Mycoplasma sp.]